MIICAKCGRENENHYKFCLGCGASLAEQQAAAPEPEPEPEPELTSCPNCNADIDASQRFCGECGFNLEDARTGQTVSVEEPAEPEPKPATAKKTAQSEAKSAPAASAGDAAGALILINPDGSPGDIVDLVPGENVVGRDSSASVFSGDEFLSPEHARFVVRDGEVDIEDLDSLNGVFVRITDIVELEHGDRVRIGQELLQFELLDQVAPIVTSQSDVVTHGSRRGGSWGRLARISGPNQASTAFLLRAKEHVIGRERGDILFRDDGYVSGTHARIFNDNDRFFIEDLKSSNGTFVQIRGKQTVRSGSLILLGKNPFRLQLRK